MISQDQMVPPLHGLVVASPILGRSAMDGVLVRILPVCQDICVTLHAARSPVRVRHNAGCHNCGKCQLHRHRKDAVQPLYERGRIFEGNALKQERLIE